MSKTILQEHQSCSVQKNARKNTKQRRNETILKFGHPSKAIAYAKTIQSLQKGQFGSKIKNAKNMQKMVLKEDQSCSSQKNRSKKHQIFEK